MSMNDISTGFRNIGEVMEAIIIYMLMLSNFPNYTYINPENSVGVLDGQFWKGAHKFTQILISDPKKEAKIVTS